MGWKLWISKKHKKEVFFRIIRDFTEAKRLGYLNDDSTKEEIEDLLYECYKLKEK
jgi:hypothetical protein